MKKRFLSILTALTLCLTLLPTAALATNEPLDGTNGINITSSNMEDATVTGSATANAAEADITDEVDLTKNPYTVDGEVAKNLLFTKEISYVASVTTADGNTTTKYEDVASAISDAVSAGKNLAIGECQHNSIDADMKCEYCGKDFSGSEAMLTTASGSVTYYETFAAASEAAQKNADSTIKLLKDVKAPGNGLNFFEGTFTVDLNGKNLTGGYATLMLVPEESSSQGSTAKVTLINTADNESTVGEGTMYAVQIQGKDKNTKLTVGKSNGTASNIKFLYKSTGTYTIDIYWGTVELYDGTYVAERSKVISGFGKNTALIIHGGSYTGATGAVYFDGSDLTIEGGEFKATNSDAFALVIGDERTGVRNVELSGGTFHGISAERSLSKLLKDGYSFKKADGSWLTETELAATSTTETVTVEEKPLKSLEVKINNTEVKDSSYSATINEKLTFTVETDPADANADVTWSIDDNHVNGSYTPDELGTHTLKCEATKEGYSLTKTVTIMVVDAASITTAPEDAEIIYGTAGVPENLAKLIATIQDGYSVTAQWFVKGENSTADEALTSGKALMNGQSYGSNTMKILDAGTYKVYCHLTVQNSGETVVNQFDSDVITLTVKQKTLTKADLTYSGVTEKVYDGTTDAPAGAKVSINSDALVGEDTLDVTGTIAYDTKNVTATKITFTPNAIENDNYRLAASEVLEVEASITAKPLTGLDFSKIAVTKVYDGTTDAGTLTGTVGFSGKVNTDDISIKAIPGVYADEKVGQNKHVTLTLSLEGKDSTNYTLAENTTYDFGAASITKADGSVTAPAAKTDLVYNGEAQALITAGSSTTGTIQYKLNNGEYSTALPEATNAGTYTVSYKVVGDENHEDVDEASFSVTIGKAAVTVTASDKTAYVGGTAPNLSKSEKDKDYTISGLFGEDTLTGEVTLKYDPEKPDMTKTGEAAIKISGTLANDNYDVAYADGKLTITTRPSSGGSSGGGSSTTKTETTNNPDGSTTKTETKSDGTVVETTTNKDGSTTKTETKKDGSSVTENKDASGSTATVKTDKNGSTEAEAKISEKAVADAKESGEAVKVPAEVKAGENSSSAPTVKVELPKNAGETKVEIPVKNVSGGTVAVIVHPDGTEEIVKDSLPTENGIQLTVSGNTTVKIMDNSKDFVDVKDHWAKDAIDFVSARELVNGIDAAHYAPDAATTRAQLWTILGRQNDADLTGGANWYEKAQAWSVANGISDGTNPNGTITRAQMVTMLWRTAGSAAAESKTGFTDVSVDSYYAQAVAWAVENGITTGVGGGRFDPNATCTRAQIATFLARSLK